MPSTCTYTARLHWGTERVKTDNQTISKLTWSGNTGGLVFTICAWVDSINLLVNLLVKPLCRLLVLALQTSEASHLSSPAPAPHAPHTQGHALEVGVQRKLASNLQNCRDAGLSCVPLVAGRFGRGFHFNDSSHRPIDSSPIRCRPRYGHN